MILFVVVLIYFMLNAILFVAISEYIINLKRNINVWKKHKELKERARLNPLEFPTRYGMHTEEDPLTGEYKLVGTQRPNPEYIRQLAEDWFPHPFSRDPVGHGYFTGLICVLSLLFSCYTLGIIEL